MAFVFDYKFDQSTRLGYDRTDFSQQTLQNVEYANYTVSIRGGELLQQMMSVLLIVYAREIYKANQTIAFRKRYIYLLLIYGFVYVAGWPLLDHLQKYFVADYSEAIDMYIYNIWRAPIGLLYSYFTIRIFAIGAVNTTLIIMIALGIAAYYILSSISDIKIFTNAYYTIMLLLTFTLYNIQRSLRSNAKQSN